ncbi:hypothetical protein HOLDEFILI_00141 [Holdemania filiformis DSM 12042]|uniref:Uncharacterized protein n=1 Tax=Holdemania filiformis DSM 12042 TaxID=545696 RepID=B9Y2W6_9FIRM|nr:hypothetical protein HOLDEFILI_00141 [Holdemania filiformis DSM 12042]
MKLLLYLYNGKPGKAIELANKAWIKIKALTILSYFFRRPPTLRFHAFPVLPTENVRPFVLKTNASSFWFFIVFNLMP